MKQHRISAALDDETLRLLQRIAQQEFRTNSSAVGMLIRAEAARRGMIGRAPTVIAKER